MLGTLNNFMIEPTLKKNRHPLEVYIKTFSNTPNSWVCPRSFLATIRFWKWQKKRYLQQCSQQFLPSTFIENSHCKKSCWLHLDSGKPCRTSKLSTLLFEKLYWRLKFFRFRQNTQTSVTKQIIRSCLSRYANSLFWPEHIIINFPTKLTLSTSFLRPILCR